MKIRAALVGASLLALALVGCAETDASPAPSTSPTQSVPAPSPSQSMPQESGPPPLACNTLVTPETLDGFEAAGWEHDVDFESRVRAESRIEMLFFEFGGLSCFWFVPNSHDWFAASYSTLTDAQTAQAQARLDADGYLRSEGDGVVTYSVNPETSSLGYNETYVFEPGAWYHSNHPEGVQEIRAVVAARG